MGPHYRPKNNGQLVNGLSRKPISVVLCLCNVTTSKVMTEYLCIVCVVKNLGIASAGAAGLKEQVGVLQVTMRACPFWDLAIPFGRNGSMVFKWLTSGSKDPTAEVIE